MTITKLRVSRRAHRALSNAAFTCAAALAATGGIGALGGASAGAEHIPYMIRHLGYFNQVHTNGNKAQNTFAPIANPMNESGSVIGHSTRFERPTEEGTFLASGQTAWLYHQGVQQRIGLIEARDGDQSIYIQPETNNQSSSAGALNSHGIAAGSSVRYKNATEEDGVSIWIHRPGEEFSQRIGNFTDNHTRGTFESSTLVALNNNPLGQAVGTAARYVGVDGINSGGQSAWYYDGETTRQIGLYQDNEHGDEDLQRNSVQFLNDNSVSAGTAVRYNDTGTIIGTSVWINTTSATEKIGLFTGTANSGPGIIDYTQNTSGTRESSLLGLNANDQAVGVSFRYREATFAGLSTWIHSAGSTTQIGLTSAGDHTKNDPAASDHQSQNSAITKFNDAGDVLGTSARFAGGATNKGQSAWVYNGSETIEVGLTTGAHVTDETNKRRFSVGTHLNQRGDAAGFSHRYDELNAQRGQSAWVYDGSESFQAGLVSDDDSTNGDYVKDDTKDQYSIVVALNNGSVSGAGPAQPGDAVGHSRRYVESTQRGQAAWYYDGTTHESTRIGLFDQASFTNSENLFQNTQVRFLNDAGQAAGTSTRYNGEAAQQGQSAWFYDSLLDDTFELTITDSLANADLRWDLAFLSDAGEILGTYRDFGDSVDAARAFLWDFNVLDNPTTPMDERFHDLGDMIEGGLTDAGWASLHSALEMSDFKHIRGFGTLLNTDYDMPFLMTPVPEPTGIALLALGGLALLPRRRRN